MRKFESSKLLIRKIGVIAFLIIVQPIFAQENLPHRIISLGPSITKGLYLLGAEDRLIANTTYCVNPPEAKNKEKIGTAREVNIEKVFNLKPDLVLATSLTDPRASKKLQNLGVKVITIPTPKNFSNMCEQFLELGRLVGKEKEAGRIVKDAEKRVASIRKRLEKLPKTKVLVQVGARPLVAARGDYFVNDYIELAGGVNIAKGARNGIYSREEILKADPEAIIIATMGMVGEEEKKVWQNYKTLSAVRNSRIYVMDTDNLTSPTPESFVETLDKIVLILHPGETR